MLSHENLDKRGAIIDAAAYDVGEASGAVSGAFGRAKARISDGFHREAQEVGQSFQDGFSGNSFQPRRYVLCQRSLSCLVAQSCASAFSDDSLEGRGLGHVVAEYELNKLRNAGHRVAQSLRNSFSAGFSGSGGYSAGSGGYSAGSGDPSGDPNADAGADTDPGAK